MVDHSAWIWRPGVQVPLGQAIFCLQDFLQNIRSWFQDECYYTLKKQIHIKTSLWSTGRQTPSALELTRYYMPSSRPFWMTSPDSWGGYELARFQRNLLNSDVVLCFQRSLAFVTWSKLWLDQIINNKIAFFGVFYFWANTTEKSDWLQNPAILCWRHNERDGVSNCLPHDCLLNRLFRRRSKKHHNSASLASVREIHRWPVNSPHKGPVTREMFPFDDVIMKQLYT